MRERDMTQRQWLVAMHNHGMREMGFMGYVNINVPGHHIEVSKLNAGSNRRRQLAYLLHERDKAMAECPCGHINAAHILPVKNAEGKVLSHSACKCGCQKFGEPGAPTEKGKP